MTGTSKCVDPVPVAQQTRGFTDTSKDGVTYQPASAYVRNPDAQVLCWHKNWSNHTDPDISIQGRAKTANILFSVALASKLHTKHVDSVSLHPGCKIFPIPRSQHHSDGVAAIKTNLQIYLSPEARTEAINLLETNTGRKRIDLFCALISPSAWDSKDKFLTFIC